MLSKQNYIKIAEIIKHSATKDELILSLANYFGNDNPKFSREKFMKAFEE